MSTRRLDLAYEDHGTLVLLKGLTRPGRTWISEHLEEGFLLTSDGWIASESRPAEAIISGALADGLVVGTLMLRHPN
jgi:hypothetical protein